MGFGLLFIGYFLTVMNVPVFGAFGTVVRLCGAGILVYASLKLKSYNKAFGLTFIGSLAMLMMTVLLLALNVDGFLFDNLITQSKLFSDAVKTAIGYVDQGISFIFNSFILWGVYKIAKETEIRKISNNAIRNYVFVCAYYFMYLLSFLPFKGIQAAKSEFALITWILYFVFIILNILVLFSCYANICDEDDVDMERKASKFALLNKLYDEQERRAEKARAEDAAYKKERREKREQRRREKKK